MQIILKTDIAKVGKALEIVTVKDGYARNYLFPRKLAIPATRESKRMVEVNREKLKALFAQEKGAAQTLLSKIEECSVSLQRRVIEGEKLYGSVSQVDIADNLKAQGFKIEKRQVMMEEPIKQLGVYTVSIRLYEGVEAQVKVWVVKEEV